MEEADRLTSGADRGSPIERDPEADLRSEFAQVVAETEAVTPREIHVDLAIDRIDCDRARMGQLLSNLLSNAVTHGSPDLPVRVEARVLDGIFQLTVSNASAPSRPRCCAGCSNPSRGERTARAPGSAWGSTSRPKSPGRMEVI